MSCGLRPIITLRRMAPCDRLRIIVLMTVVCSSGFLLSADDDRSPRSIEQKTRVHRLETVQRSPFDAFIYLNRIPAEPDEEESPQDLAGRIFGRLANQEGRLLLKLPPDMDPQAYYGLKLFLQYSGTDSVGNCITCHTPPDLACRTTAGNSDDSTPPSLRNLRRTDEQLRQTILNKIQRSRQVADSDEDPAYPPIHLSAAEVDQIVKFLKTLQDLSDEKFREQILQATPLDTSGEFQ